jgi:hypothetical protein
MLLYPLTRRSPDHALAGAAALIVVLLAIGDSLTHRRR